MAIIRRIILGGMLVSVLCCSLTFAFAAGVWRGIPGHMTREPAEVNRVAYTITDFQLPAGYRTDYAFDLLGFSLVAYQGSSGYSHLTLIQAPPWVQANQMTPLANVRQGDRTGELTPIRDEQRMLRSQQVTVTISEGVNGDGHPYRQLSVAFEGKSGPALLLLNEIIAQWDRQMVETLLTSLN